ncbi:MAG: bacitracin ABC transporter ATP-binding protein [Desulfitibacter sp. BRH_c19]|nr:MAG: bacitracin ABC transporter ATP-binding protein [Desulfitibacter sp. BRH_c19]
METAIKTYNLSKHYSTQKAVDQLNMTVRKGEIFGFLGRNGAGKTTTIRMLLGLIKPTEGNIEIFGMDLKKNKNRILNRVGAIVEYSGFYPNLTGTENLQVYARLMGLKKQKAIQEALEIVGLADETTKLVGNYSMGMKQRLGIARAIMHHPELLIFDEPTNGLDPIGIKEMRKLIKKLANERDITILVSSHILSEIEQLADRVGIIHHGVLLEEIDLKALKNANRKYLQIRTSSISQAIKLMENNLNIFEHELVEENVLRIYNLDTPPAQINRLLVESQLEVMELVMKEDNLEDYFIGITGGGSIG